MADVHKLKSLPCSRVSSFHCLANVYSFLSSLNLINLKKKGFVTTIFPLICVVCSGFFFTLGLISQLRGLDGFGNL